MVGISVLETISFFNDMFPTVIENYRVSVAGELCPRSRCFSLFHQIQRVMFLGKPYTWLAAIITDERMQCCTLEYWTEDGGTEIRETGPWLAVDRLNPSP